MEPYFLFQFKVHRCSAFYYFYFLSPKHRRALNFRLDFLIKKGKVSAWFIIYLMQNVYKFILLFPKTTLFLVMLLVCGRCHLYLRTDVCMCWITSHIWWFLKIESYNNIQSSRTLFSWMCKPSVTHTKKKLEINLRDLLCLFIFVHKWRKCIGVIGSACVFYLNGTTPWPSWIDRGYLIVFRTLDSECHHSQSFCLEYGLG